MSALFTVGHSDRSAEALIDLLRHAAIETLVDVRARPQSARYPWFNEDVLRESLSQAGIAYHWAGRQLGGLRKARPGSAHRALAEGLQGYADYMETAAFQQAVMQLVRLADKAPTAIMCAERNPLQCHRSLIADYLLLQGVEVAHLVEPGVVKPHLLRPEARRESAALVYDRHTQDELSL